MVVFLIAHLVRVWMEAFVLWWWQIPCFPRSTQLRQFFTWKNFIY